MNNYERGEELTLDDGEKYIVVDFFEYKSKKYLYVISEKEGNEVSLVKVDGNEVEPIEDEKEYNEVFKELVNRNKEEISKYLEGIDEN
jgi:hypothetical protein